MRIWDAMIQRCNNPNTASYSNYGGRGIIVCKAWHDFKTFYDWAIVNGYQDALTIDRKRNDENYSPENCRWVTIKENQQNKRTSKFVTAFGVCLNYAQWELSPKCAVSAATLRYRVLHGWPPDKAISTPPRS